MQTKIKEPGGLHGTNSSSFSNNILYCYCYQKQQLDKTISTD